MTEIGTGAVRSLPALFKGGEWLYRKWRPTKHARVLAQRAEDLAGAVDKAELKLQQELRAMPGSGSFMPVMFTAADRRQPGSVISGEVDDTADYFELLENPRRMVVLGDPGAGKTVAATYLVRGLIQHRRELEPEARRSAEPVPVRVNTAGWDGAQEFSTWLVNRLSLDYELPTVLGAEMLDSGMILPVLDGLDEMDDETSDGTRARALLDRLNDREWTHRPVVVLCRGTEFAHLRKVGGGEGLHGAATVTLDPLPADQPADYLSDYQDRIEAAHPAWDQIITHLREHTDPEHPDSPLAEVLRNPWMLGLTATTLHRTPQAAATLLDCPTPDAVRDGLFAAQIPAAISGTHDTDQFRGYTPDNVEKWLCTLARHLERRRDIDRNGTAIRLDEIWEIAGTTRIRLLHGLTVTLLTWLGTGLALGLGAILTTSLTAVLTGELTTVLTTGILTGILTGIMAGIMAGFMRHPRAKSIAWKVPTRRRWPYGILAGLAVGLAAGLTVGLVYGLAAGLATGLTGGLAIGLLTGLETTAEDQLAMGTDARRLIRNDLQSALFNGALVGLAVGLAVGLTGGLTGGLSAGILAILTIGLVVGDVSGRFFLAVLLFKITADFPDRPAIFLEWARDSGLLRVNATAYQFRHQTYQQWLLHHSAMTDPPPLSSDDASAVPLSL
ncbi:NACHT domain-containing protein [Nocardia fluminea]|uniref:NACHT domain-containing protein n=1 Tax=Nocardia fluminea TaxID=134984 RepID=UPI0033E44C6E